MSDFDIDALQTEIEALVSAKGTHPFDEAREVDRIMTLVNDVAESAYEAGEREGEENAPHWDCEESGSREEGYDDGYKEGHADGVAETLEKITETVKELEA